MGPASPWEESRGLKRMGGWFKASVLGSFVCLHTVSEQLHTPVSLLFPPDQTE